MEAPTNIVYSFSEGRILKNSHTGQIHVKMKMRREANKFSPTTLSTKIENAQKHLHPQLATTPKATVESLTKNIKTSSTLPPITPQYFDTPLRHQHRRNENQSPRY